MRGPSREQVSRPVGTAVRRPPRGPGPRTGVPKDRYWWRICCPSREQVSRRVGTAGAACWADQPNPPPAFPKTVTGGKDEVPDESRLHDGWEPWGFPPADPSMPQARPGEAQAPIRKRRGWTASRHLPGHSHPPPLLVGRALSQQGTGFTTNGNRGAPPTPRTVPGPEFPCTVTDGVDVVPKGNRANSEWEPRGVAHPADRPRPPDFHAPLLVRHMWSQKGTGFTTGGNRAGAA